MKNEENKNEEEYVELNKIEILFPLIVSCLSFVLLAIRIFIIYYYTENHSNKGQLQFGLYMTDCFLWLMFGLFFYFMYLNIKLDCFHVSEMKFTSFFAGLASLLKLVVTIIIDIMPYMDNIMNNLYGVSECIVWLMISIFFFWYWIRSFKFDIKSDLDSY